MKSLMGALILAAASSLVAASPISVRVFVDQDVINDHGREWVDINLTKAMNMSNKVLEKGEVSETREIYRVDAVPISNDVSIASLGTGGTLDGVKLVCDYIAAGEYPYADNVVWIIPQSGNSNRVGNEGYCYPGDRHVVVASAQVGSLLGQLIAHELGHADGLGHEYADQVYIESGEVLLMNSKLKSGLSDRLVDEGDIQSLKEAHKQAEEYPFGFGYPAPDIPLFSDLAILFAENTVINKGDEEVNFTIEVPVLEKDASFEVYTRSGNALAGEDYQEKIERINILSGQTTSKVSIKLYPESKRTVTESFFVGIRYGDGVQAKQEIEITLPVNEVEEGSGGPGGSGGSGGSIYLGLLLLPFLKRRLKP